MGRNEAVVEKASRQPRYALGLLSDDLRLRIIQQWLYQFMKGAAEMVRQVH